MKSLQDIITFISVIALAAAVILLATNSGKLDQASQQVIQVTGEAKMTVMPDEAVAYIRAEQTSLTAQEAQSAVAEKINNIMAALKKQGLADNDIETSSFSVQPKQEWNPETQKYEQNGFIASHLLKVTSKDIASFGNLLDEATKAGATGIDNVYFQLTKEKQAIVRKALLLEAGQDARAKAEAMAAGVNVRLGKVVSVQESGPVFWPMLAVQKAEAGGAGTEIVPQNIDVSASISVGYEIR